MTEFERFKTYGPIYNCSWNKACDAKSIYPEGIRAVLCLSSNTKPSSTLEIYKELGINSYTFEIRETHVCDDLAKYMPYIARIIHTYVQGKESRSRLLIHSNLNGVVTLVLALYFGYGQRNVTQYVSEIENNGFDPVTDNTLIAVSQNTSTIMHNVVL
jgi:hypothetical protein